MTPLTRLHQILRGLGSLVVLGLGVGCTQRDPLGPEQLSIVDLGAVSELARPIWFGRSPELLVRTGSGSSRTLVARQVPTGTTRDIVTLGSTTLPYSVDYRRNVLICTTLLGPEHARVTELRLDGTVAGEYVGPSDATDFLGVISPDGTRLAFVRDVGTADRYQVCWRPAGDYGGPVALVIDVGSGSSPLQLSWLGNDRLLANFEDVDDSERTTRTGYVNGGAGEFWALADAFVSSTPDGRWVTGVEGPLTAGRLFIQRIDGTGRTIIDTSGDAAIFPEWSPDGQAIAFLAINLTTRETRLKVALLPPLQ